MKKSNEVTQTDVMKSLGGYISSSPVPNNMINTICLFADTKYQSVSSSMVKELFNLDKDIIRYVEPTIKEKMLIKKRSIVK